MKRIPIFTSNQWWWVSLDEFATYFIRGRVWLNSLKVCAHWQTSGHSYNGCVWFWKNVGIQRCWYGSTQWDIELSVNRPTIVSTQCQFGGAKFDVWIVAIHPSSKKKESIWNVGKLNCTVDFLFKHVFIAHGMNMQKPFCIRFFLFIYIYLYHVQFQCPYHHCLA